jgi:ketosteroid isomerase-like protein
MRYLLLACLAASSLVWAGSAAAAEEAPEVYSPTPMYADRYSPEEQLNLAAAETMFNAFAAGEMDTFYGLLADDVVWEINGNPDLVPLHGAHYGVDAVRAWVEQLNAMVELLEFGADSYFADGDTVFVLFHDSGPGRATGKMIEQRELALITFENGEVVYFLCFGDSAQEHWALTPDPEA